MEMVKQTERNYVTQSANGYIKQEHQLQTHSVTIKVYQLIQVCFIFFKLVPNVFAIILLLREQFESRQVESGES